MEKFKKKGIKCIKSLILCIICLLSLNLSLNASAVDFTANLRYIDTINVGNWTCYYRRSDETALTQRCNAPAISGADALSVIRVFDYFKSGNAVEVKKNRLYEVRMMVTITNTNQSTSYPLPGVLNIVTSQTTPDFRTIALQQNIENTGTSYTFTTYQNQVYAVEYYPQQTREYSFLLKPSADGTINLQIGREGGQTFNLPPSNDNLYVPQFNIRLNQWVNVYEYQDASDEAAEKELEDRDNLETQQGETESGAEDSSQDIGSATTNITGIVSTFLGNLQNLNANQCTLPEITAYGFSLGQLNLCTFQPPSWVQSISSAVVSLMMLGLAIHLFKRIMGIAKSLAGGK